MITAGSGYAAVEVTLGGTQYGEIKHADQGTSQGRVEISVDGPNPTPLDIKKMPEGCLQVTDPDANKTYVIFPEGREEPQQSTKLDPRPASEVCMEYLMNHSVREDGNIASNFRSMTAMGIDPQGREHAETTLEYLKEGKPAIKPDGEVLSQAERKQWIGALAKEAGYEIAIARPPQDGGYEPDIRPSLGDHQKKYGDRSETNVMQSLGDHQKKYGDRSETNVMQSPYERKVNRMTIDKQIETLKDLPDTETYNSKVLRDAIIKNLIKEEKVSTGMVGTTETAVRSNIEDKSNLQVANHLEDIKDGKTRYRG